MVDVDTGEVVLRDAVCGTELSMYAVSDVPNKLVLTVRASCGDGHGHVVEVDAHVFLCHVMALVAISKRVQSG